MSGTKSGKAAASLVGRGGLKLEAALGRFGLGGRVKGTAVVDVGASTGGFVDVLLRQGARRVTAVDVGHGQLHASLRDDPRVENLERTDFKKAALRVAPGPYDMFTVDVSFVAARNMLRALAFRLRDGAEGVVLLKPQFEVPRRLVRGGDVSDPALRERALAAFRKKAEALGFRILAQADSPVPGESGTVEMLLHLRFEGRTEKLPQRREEKPGAAERPRSRNPDPSAPPMLPVNSAELRWFAVAAPGLEAVVEAELRALAGARGVARVEGGVDFRAGLVEGAAANLHLRAASRLLLRLGEVRARDFAPLRRGLAKLPWESFVPRDRALKVSAAATRSRLYHTGALAETLELAVRDRVGALPGAPAPQGTKADDDEVTRLLLRGEADVFTASVDASGELLHRRGARVEVGPAPLRETLAAAVLSLAGYEPGRPFVDAMCGAGTLALEAAAIAIGQPPGRGRTFACERWPCFDRDAWAGARAAAERGARELPAAPLYACDVDPAALEVARRNADRAELAPHLTFVEAALGAWRPPVGPGLVVLNPPYGRRLATAGGPRAFFRAVGRHLRAGFAGWRAAVLLPDARLEPLLALRVTAHHRLFHGGLRVELVVGEVPS